MTSGALAADEPLDLPALIEQGRLTVAAVDQLRGSVDKQAAAQDRQTTATNRRLVATVVLVLVLIGVAVDNRVQINALKRLMCPVVTATITRPGEIGPSTPHGRDVERSSRELAVQLGCAILPR